MRSLKSAASLLAAASTVDTLASLAEAVGFRGAPLPVDRDARAALGLGDTCEDARIITGAGTLRALLVECPAHTPVRDAVAAIAARLTARAPQLLWLLLVTQRGGNQLAVASWSPERSRPRVAALIVNRAHIVASDVETLGALASVSEAADVLTHAYWLDILGRDALTRRFYRALEGIVAELAREARGGGSASERQELALLYVSRLLFLSFLESKGWLDGDHRFLEHSFSRCMERGGDYHQRVLLPLFFGTLNTPRRHRARAARAFGRIPFLNGGLFAPTARERRYRDLRFRDETLGLVFGELLGRYRFTAREESTSWSEAAIDPEMLGKAFESLMASRERRASGAFYTPQALVASVTRAALLDALGDARVAVHQVESALRGDPVDARTARALRERVGSLRVLDPACGSGAFLVHVLEELAALLGRLGDGRPISTLRRELLTRSIFGVDVNPTAVWLCELRLWLSVVIQSEVRDPLAVTPLPNLDRHIRVGDSLSGDAPHETTPRRGGARLARLRDRYVRATGARKRSLERSLERAERALAMTHVESELARCSARRKDLLSVLRGRDLFGERVRATSTERLRLAAERSRSRELHAMRRALRDGGALPFTFATHFPDVMQCGGFDVIVGNPPWVRLHRIPPRARAALRERYAVFANAAWRRGAEAARAGAGFAAQVDLAALFLERSLTLLRDGGTLALLLPSKMWRSLAGGGARQLLCDRARVLTLEDWSESPSAFDAAVYPSLLVARVSTTRDVSDGKARPLPATISMALHRRTGTLRWDVAPDRLTLDEDASSPWLTVPPAVRAAFERLARAGVALAESHLGRPQLGVKCGCNDAFVVEWHGGDGSLAAVRSNGRSGVVERSLLRPLLRGESMAPWRARGAAEWLLWTHGDDGLPLRVLPPNAERWLLPWRHQLAARADARGGAPWWSLFRTGSAAREVVRVVWADFGRAPQALVLQPDDPTVALNSCYVLPCPTPEDAYAFAALLNSPLAAAWLNVLAEPARGGYRRYLAWTVALLPIPRDWPLARRVLAPLAERASGGDAVTSGELLMAVLRAYRVRSTDLEPLLTWSAR